MTAPSLRETQRWMQRRIVSSDVSDDPLLNPQGGAPGAARLAVYADGYLARVEEALAEAYPAIRQVLGRRTFSALTHDYAAAHPSHDYNLSHLGRHLPAFLPAAAVTRDLPFLPDLARLEWAVAEAFHVTMELPLDPASLAGLPLEAWDRARLVFQPGVARIASDWPILDIWEARDRPISDVRIELVNRPQRVLVSRRGLEVQCELLEPPQDRLFEALLAGAPLAAACRPLAEAAADPPPLADWFARWAAAGLFTRLA